VTVVSVDKREVTVKFVIFGPGEPLIVTWIIKVSKRAVTNSSSALAGGRERGWERERPVAEK